MKIFFMRHAEAEDGTDDAKRALTKKGRRDAREMGRFLRRGAVVLDAAFTSPLVRARETAEEVLRQCPMAKNRRLRRSRALVNGAEWRALAVSLAKMPADASVLLVGHEPSLSAHIRRYLGMKRATSLVLSKGAVVRIDVEDRGECPATLRFMIGPKQLS
ncbi:MAG: histidine phosphatase family protein [Verrucomicrobiales bacterium]|nr:histidine phosphatase family protein [Verrucomicrobiales bacterium]